MMLVYSNILYKTTYFFSLFVDILLLLISLSFLNLRWCPHALTIPLYAVTLHFTLRMLFLYIFDSGLSIFHFYYFVVLHFVDSIY